MPNKESEVIDKIYNIIKESKSSQIQTTDSGLIDKIDSAIKDSTTGAKVKEKETTVKTDEVLTENPTKQHINIYNKGEEFSWKKDIIAPLVITVCAGATAVGVGMLWEDYKFRKETVFEKRVDLIMDSRKQASDVFIEFDTVRRQIRANETYFNSQKDKGGTCDASVYKSQTEELKRIGLKINYLEAFSKDVVKNQEIAENIKNFKTNLDSYLKCISENNTCDQCTQKFPELMSPLQKVIEQHTVELNNQINRTE